jgi:uncharacterized membrane protein
VLQILSRHKYKLFVFGLLAAASVVSVLLARARMAYSNTDDYSTLIWNLGLAWIPFVIASIAYVVSWSRRLLYLVVPISAFIWLIFFPNAPYILTDFQHLSTNTSNAPLWYDVLMLIWFAWTGLLLGLVSLHFMQEIVTRAFGRTSGWLFAILVTVLSSVGILLGRFYRWNSWDILGDPMPIAHDIWGWVRHPFTNLRVYGFTLLYTVLFLFVYLAMHAFGRIMQERQLQDKAGERSSF